MSKETKIAIDRVDVAITGEKEELPINRVLIMGVAIGNYPEFASGTKGQSLLLEAFKKSADIDSLDSKLDAEKGGCPFYLENNLVVDTRVIANALGVGLALDFLGYTKAFQRKANDLTRAELLRFGNESEVATTERPEIAEFVEMLTKEIMVQFATDKTGIEVTQLCNSDSIKEKYGLGKFFGIIVDGLEVEHNDDLVSIPDIARLSSYLDEPDFRKINLRGSTIEKEALRYTLRVVHAMRDLRDNINGSLFDKEIMGHDELRNIIIKRSKNFDPSTNYLLTSYLANRDSFRDFYRRCNGALLLTGDSNLYEALMNMVLRAYEDGKTNGNTIVLDDLQAVYRKSDEKYKRIEQEAHNKTINEIISHTSIKTYDIDCLAIDWGDIAPPSSALLTLSKGQPYMYRYILSYSNDLGVVLDVEIDIDGKNMGLDWNVLQSPDQTPDMASEFLGIGGKLLQQVAYTAKQEYETRSVKTPLAKLYEQKPRVDRQIHRGSGIHQQAAPRQVGFEFTPKPDLIKEIILVPEEDVLTDMIKSFSSADRKIIVDSIEAFNRSGEGRFKRLQTPASVDEKLYELRTHRESGGAGIRVILRETKGEQKERNFDILLIEDRDSVFRKFWK